MKKCILSIVLSLAIKIVAAQYSLVFCESVSAGGVPEKVSRSFIQTGSERKVTLFASADGSFDTEQIKFTVYYINAEGNEEEITKLPHKTERGWNYAWKEVSLYNQGTYRVKVYNGTGTYLTSANLSIKSASK